MSLKQKIFEDLKAAMRSGKIRQRNTIRLLQAAVKQREVDERIILDDGAVIIVIERMLKQRRDSITQYEAAQRADLADIEREEIAILSAYMPQPLSDSEIDDLVAEAVLATGAIGIQNIGKVMAQLKPKLAGRADMAKVSSLIKERISN